MYIVTQRVNPGTVGGNVERDVSQTSDVDRSVREVRRLRRAGRVASTRIVPDGAAVLHGLPVLD
jgi:hypothetical protein